MQRNSCDSGDRGGMGDSHAPRRGSKTRRKKGAWPALQDRTTMYLKRAESSVQRQGDTMSAKCKPGAGATFRFTLPAL